MTMRHAPTCPSERAKCRPRWILRCCEEIVVVILATFDFATTYRAVAAWNRNIARNMNAYDQQNLEVEVKYSLRHSAIVCVAALGSITVLVPSVIAATAEERAKCEQMSKQMGTAPPHDHGKDKTGSPGAMTTDHARCKEIMAEPVQGHKDKTGSTEGKK